jgi:hypothetical protein
MKSIQLTHPADIRFAKIAAGAKVGGATLPSGFEVPASQDGETWIIFGTSLVLVPLNPEFPICETPA